MASPKSDSPIRKTKVTLESFFSVNSLSRLLVGPLQGLDAQIANGNRCGFKLRWPGDSQHESGRFARIDSQKNPSESRESPQTSDSHVFSPQSAIRKKGVQFGNPETIRKNQAIRANLQIDSRESGHLRFQIAMISNTAERQPNRNPKRL